MLVNLLWLFSGIGTFLVGMKLVSKNLESVAGSKVKKLFDSVSGSTLKSVGVGVGSSAVLQSSSATTVILISLVNSGIITLFQATGIIMGANVGTTFSSLLMAFSYLPIGEAFSFLTFLGMGLVIASKKEKTRSVGWILSSAGLMFIGLKIIGEGAKGLSEYPKLVEILSYYRNPFILLLIGAIFTSVIQSSSALTGILITFAHVEILPVVSAFYLIMGGNVGSCMTAMLASYGENQNAKRTALINLLFNGIGVALFLPLVVAFGEKTVQLCSGFSASVIIAYFQIAFNFLTTVALLPFIKQLTELSVKILPEVKA